MLMKIRLLPLASFKGCGGCDGHLMRGVIVFAETKRERRTGLWISSQQKGLIRPVGWALTMRIKEPLFNNWVFEDPRVSHSKKGFLTLTFKRLSCRQTRLVAWFKRIRKLSCNELISYLWFAPKELLIGVSCSIGSPMLVVPDENSSCPWKLNMNWWFIIFDITSGFRALRISI